MNANMLSYYDKRAGEYEKVYSKPGRQEDLVTLEKMLQDIFAGKNLLEIACGTGYWTEKISRTASSIFATDINQSVINMAKAKKYPASVSFNVCDLFELQPGSAYENLFAGFIWSHIKLQELDTFIHKVNSLVKPGGKVVFTDNNYVQGSCTAISEMYDVGNTFQLRKLADGSIHKVLKNFPSEDMIRNLLHGTAQQIHFLRLEYYWILAYQVPEN